jgi:hypothetical protein
MSARCVLQFISGRSQNAYLTISFLQPPSENGIATCLAMGEENEGTKWLKNYAKLCFNLPMPHFFFFPAEIHSVSLAHKIQ